MFTEEFKRWLHRFHQHQLPLFGELSDIGLYMDQVVSETNRYTKLITGVEVTKSMVNSYVKQGLVTRPEKKRYGQIQLAQIILVSLLKTLYSLDIVHQYLSAMSAELTWQEAYDLWVTAFDERVAEKSGQSHPAAQASPAVAELIKLTTAALINQRISEALVQAMTDSTEIADK